MTDIRSKLDALTKQVRTHRVVTVYADGATKSHESISLAGAENFAVGERRKIGRDLISPVTGKSVRVVDVIVEPISDLLSEGDAFKGEK